jgi:microtubule-associated protein-like 6
MPTTEIWGMTVHPNKKEVYTCSDDGSLRVWDIATKKQTRIINLLVDPDGKPLSLEDLKAEPPLSCQARSVEISPDLKHAAVGFRDGSVKVFNTAAADWSLIKVLPVC